MVIPENMHTSNITLTEEVVFKTIYTYTYMYTYILHKHTQRHIMKINEKRGREFERQEDQVYGKVWKRKSKMM